MESNNTGRGLTRHLFRNRGNGTFEDVTGMCCKDWKRDKQRLGRRGIAGEVSLEGEAKNPIDELVLSQDITLLHSSDLTFADLVHRLVALNRLTCTTELTKMLLGADPFLDGTVILLQDVVQVLNRPVTAAPS